MTIQPSPQPSQLRLAAAPDNYDVSIHQRPRVTVFHNIHQIS
jgi:hypothetical protein